jgi:hypothetical protein
MEIDFELDQRGIYSREVMYRFCNALVRSIKDDIKVNVIPAKLSGLEEALLNADWITWTTKPKSINVEHLVLKILECITWRERKNSFQIYIDPKPKMPYTKDTTLDQIARFIDKGNNVAKYTTMFSRVFNHYQKNINVYWISYKNVGYIVDIESEEE